MAKKPAGYMVFFNDLGGLCIPMGADPGCEGALQADDDAPLLFASRPGARKAITISERWNRLLEAQGKRSNDDFTTHKARLHIVPVYPAQ